MEPVINTVVTGKTSSQTQSSAGLSPVACIPSQYKMEPVVPHLKKRLIQAAPETPPVPDLIVSQPDCFVSTGKITSEITPIGVGYKYSRDGKNFQSGTVFAGLTPGTYTITVQNEDGLFFI